MHWRFFCKKMRNRLKIVTVAWITYTSDVYLYTCLSRVCLYALIFICDHLWQSFFENSFLFVRIFSFYENLFLIFSICENLFKSLLSVKIFSVSFFYENLFESILSVWIFSISLNLYYLNFHRQIHFLSQFINILIFKFNSQTY